MNDKQAEAVKEEFEKWMRAQKTTTGENNYDSKTARVYADALEEIYNHAGEEIGAGKPLFLMTLEEFDKIYPSIIIARKNTGKRQRSSYTKNWESASKRFREFLEGKYPQENFFEWTDLYENFANELSSYKDKRRELLARMIEANKIKKDECINEFLNAFNKRTNNARMTDIDPFSIMGTLNYFAEIDGKGDLDPDNIEKRKNTLQFWVELIDAPNFNKKWNATPYLYFRGIPTLMPLRKVMPDPQKTTNEHIDILWDFFAEAIEWAKTGGSNTTQFEESFDKAIKVSGLGDATLTGALFWMRPYKFLSLDEPCCDYIKGKFDLEYRKSGDYISGSSYISFIHKIKEDCFADDNCPVHTFPQLSFNAYRFRKGRGEREWKKDGNYSVPQMPHPHSDPQDRPRYDVKLTKGAREALVKWRANTGELRNYVLDEWHHQCSVGDKDGNSLCTNSDFLDTAHIKPYRELEEGEEETRFNGLMLTPNLHKAFDKGIFAFASDGTIKIKKEHEEVAKQLGIDETMRLCQPKSGTLNDETKKHLRDHYNNIFKEN